MAAQRMTGSASPAFPHGPLAPQPVPARSQPSSRAPSPTHVFGEGAQQTDMAAKMRAEKDRVAANLEASKARASQAESRAGQLEAQLRESQGSLSRAQEEKGMVLGQIAGLQQDLKRQQGVVAERDREIAVSKLEIDGLRRDLESEKRSSVALKKAEAELAAAAPAAYFVPSATTAATGAARFVPATRSSRPA
jgi:hypothetical protein